MDFTRTLPAITVIGVLVTSLLTGPIVSPTDPSSAESEPIPGEGSADVEIISIPEAGTLDPVEHASSGYKLFLPSATVNVSNLSGRPMLVYKLRVPELGFISGTTYVLNSKFTGRQTLEFEEPVLDRASLERATYHGEVLVIKRVHERDTVLYRGNVTLRAKQ